MRFQWIAAAAFLIVAPAAAQGPQERTLAADAGYRHGPTGLDIPAALPGLPPRARIAVLVPDLDEFIEYKTANAEESATLYIFRRVTGDIPVWLDRAARQVLARDIYGGPAPLAPPAAFIPPGQSNASGLMQVFRVSKPPYRSTGVALVPLGEDWLVKLRYSSTTLAPEELGARMQAVLGALAWPKTIAPVPAATPIADCTTTLRAKDDAKPRGDALGSSLLQGALLGAIAKGEVKPEKTAHVAMFCRDPAARPELGNAGVYRADGERDGYLIALGDAGRGIYVSVDSLGALLNSKAQKNYSITLYNVAQSFIFAPRDGLPKPEQALAIVKSERPTSSVTTWRGKGDVTIDAKAVR
ncbi:MAG: hypothetical protein A4S16_07200 [Proteobacteria bacterium SG_bin6]|nr:MAG: hypothetical protein A4S16_07200 [Proteobacteria bacterium SG_bin6]